MFQGDIWRNQNWDCRYVTTQTQTLAYIGRLMQDLIPNEWNDQDAFVLEQLTNFVINSTYFHCPELQATYHQVVGLPMGTNCAPELANLVLLARNAESGQFWVSVIPNASIHWWHHRHRHNRTHQQGANGLSWHRSLTENEEGTFLDLHITMVKTYENFATPMWHFNFQVYQKPLNKYMYTSLMHSHCHKEGIDHRWARALRTTIIQLHWVQQHQNVAATTINQTWLPQTIRWTTIQRWWWFI